MLDIVSYIDYSQNAPSKVQGSQGRPRSFQVELPKQKHVCSGAQAPRRAAALRGLLLALAASSVTRPAGQLSAPLVGS